MTNRKLTITWKQDVLTVVKHNGSRINYNGETSRSERETFRNVKSKEAALKILSRRKKKEIIFAAYNNETIYPAKK